MKRETFEAERDRIIASLRRAVDYLNETKHLLQGGIMDRMKQEEADEVAVAKAMETLGFELGQGIYGRSVAKGLVGKVEVVRGPRAVDLYHEKDLEVNNNWNYVKQRHEGAMIRVRKEKNK